MRWHPVADEWRPAEEPLPETEAETAAEEQRHKAAGEREHRDAGHYPWEVVIDLPHVRATPPFADKLSGEGLPVRRRWSYVLVGAETEEAAVELGHRLEAEAPDGSRIGIRANPKDVPHPVFVMIGSWEPGVFRDLGI
jgi:hypothetical protein